MVIASDPSISFPKAADKKEAGERVEPSPPDPGRPVWSVPVRHAQGP